MDNLLTPPAAASPTAATAAATPTAAGAATTTRAAATARATAGGSLLTHGPALRAPLSGLTGLAAAAVHITKCAARPLRASRALGRPVGSPDTARAARTTRPAYSTDAAGTARPTSTAHSPGTARPTSTAYAAGTARPTSTAHSAGSTWPTSAADTTHTAGSTRPTRTADATHASGTARACRRPHRIARYGDLRTAGRARRSAGRTGVIAGPPTPSASAPTVRTDLRPIGVDVVVLVDVDVRVTAAPPGTRPTP
jgi:hypothetical protein